MTPTDGAPSALSKHRAEGADAKAFSFGGTGLHIQDLGKTFSVGRKRVVALEDVDLTVRMAAGHHRIHLAQARRALEALRSR